MLRKITAFLCTVVMIVSVIAPMSVMAEREASCWNVSATKSGQATIENGVLVLDGTNGATAGWRYTATMSPNITLSFSAKVDTFNTMGVQFWNGAGYRFGYYMSESRLSTHGATAYINTSVGNGWHDYRIEVVDGTQTIYVDNVKLATCDGQVNSGEASLYFWTNPGGKMQIGYWSLQAHDGKPVRLKTASYAGEWLPGEDYTPGFTQDWKTDTGNWYLTDSEAVQWNKEEGYIRFDGSKASTGAYLPVQHAVNFTENFDWDWKMRLIRNTNGSIQIKFAGDGLNSYFYVEKKGLVKGARYWESLVTGNPGSQGMGIPIFLGDDWGEWMDMGLHRRGNYLTLYVNGGKVRTWRTYTGVVDPGILAWSLEGDGVGNMSSDCFDIGEVSYKPYFPTVDMVKPYYRSEYAQGTDVELQATASTATDYIDYYVDDVKVGRGYAPNYTYILKNVQVGTYNISAGVGDERSVASVMTVKPAFATELRLSAEEIPYGGTVEASLWTDALAEEVDVAKADYYVNGELVATSTEKPFKATLKDMKVGTASVYAKVTNKQDAILTTETKTVNVSADGNSAITFGREYLIDYTYTAGTGKVEAEDGYFKLSVENAGNVLKYLDEDGTVKDYKMTQYKESVTGYGDYRIVTTAGYAEVYYNGHLLHSFYMPRTENANKLSYSGVENFVMTGRGDKYTVFHEEWKGEAEYATDAINIGQFSALEFDKTDLSDEVIEYYDGRYQMYIEFKDGKVYTYDQGKTGDDIKREFLLENPAEVGYYRVNVTEGVCQLWCDNKLIGGWAGPRYAHKAQVIRKMTNPSASTFVAVKTVDDIYYHTEDFSGDKEMIAHDYWIKDRDVKATINQDEETGKYHTTVSSSTEGRFYLNAYTKDVVFSAKVKVDSAKDFYMMTRLHPIYYDTKLGYDFEKGQYYAEYEVFGGGSKASIGSERVTFPGEFTVGEWHDIEVTNNETHLVMKVDGKTVIDTQDLWLVQSGNVGFGVVGGTLHFTDFSYEGRGKTGTGVYTVFDNEGYGYNDFFYRSDGSVVAPSSRSAGAAWRITRDGGKTWEAPVSHAHGGKTNVLNMADGRLGYIDAAELKPHFYVSEDDGETWSNRVDIPVNHYTTYLVIQNSFSNVAKNGRILLTTDECTSETSGKVGVWWSDDNGATWTESDTFFEETVNGVNMQEASLVDMPEEGHYRIFFRTDRSFVYYADSYDGMKTFDQMKTMPSPFKAPVCTFKVRRDVYEDQTYYALWTYDTENSWDNRYGCPRNRVALAVSRDGMKTWEFAQSVFDIGDYPIGLVRNYTLEIIEDTIYISMNGQSQDGFIMTIDKNKLKTVKRFEEVHERTFLGTVSDEESYALSVIPNTTGQAWILGNYESVEVADGKFVKAESLAKAAASTIEISGNIVTMKLGDGYVKFTEGSTSYDVNGVVTDFGSVCMKNGFIDINAWAKAFGKTMTENKAGNGWVVWCNEVYTDYYRQQLEGLI